EQLEADEPPRPLQAGDEGVDAAVARLLGDVGGLDAEGGVDGGAVAPEEHPRARGHRQPPVRVARDAVGARDARAGGADPRGRSLGDSAAAPPQAASTWNHSPSASDRRASAGRGSMTPAAVVPAVPTTRKGRRPARRSAAMRRSRSGTDMRRSASTATRWTA